MRKGAVVGVQSRLIGVWAGILVLGAARGAPLPEAAHGGAQLYQQRCAMCHDHGEALRAPTLSTLKGMRYQQIYYALTIGKMQAQAGCSPARSARISSTSSSAAPG